MKNKLLILSLFLALSSLVKNVHSMNHSIVDCISDVLSGEKTFTEDEQSKMQEFIAKVKDYDSNGDIKTFLEQTYLRKCIKFIQDNDFEGFKKYFKFCKIDPNAQLITGFQDFRSNGINKDMNKTLLMFAVESGNIPLMEYLISENANVDISTAINIKKNFWSLEHSITPLSIAVTSNNIQAVSLLIKAQANLDINIDIDTPGLQAYKESEVNKTPPLLEYILGNKNIKKEIVELIFSSVDEQYIRNYFFCLMGACVDNDNIEMFEYLVKKQLINVDSIYQTDDVDDMDCGCAPLHCAVFYGELCDVKLLIKLGANVNLLSGYVEGRVSNMTPLMIACQKGNYTIVEELLNAHADVTIQNPEGLTAYDIAKQQYNEAKAKNVKGRRDCKGIYKYGKTIRILNQWNKNIAKEVMQAVPDFPNEISGIVVDILTNSNLKANELAEIKKAVNVENSSDKEEKELSEKPLETAVKKKKRNRESDDKQLDSNDPNNYLS